MPVRITPVHWVTVPDDPTGLVRQFRRIVRRVANAYSVTNWNSLLRKLCQPWAVSFKPEARPGWPNGVAVANRAVKTARFNGF